MGEGNNVFQSFSVRMAIRRGSDFNNKNNTQLNWRKLYWQLTYPSNDPINSGTAIYTNVTRGMGTSVVC